MTDRPTVAITMGDPAGIGAEVIVGAWPAAREHARPVVVGDLPVVRDAIRLRGADLDAVPVESVAVRPEDPGTIPVLDLGRVRAPEYGELREANGAASLAYVERAIELAVAGDVDAITTAPINKQATRLAGSEHAGHTDMLADATGTTEYAMLLIEEDLRVAHVSTHVPLREAIERVTTERVYSTIEVTHGALLDLGIETPRIGIAGLNPHAGEDGLLGHEDDTAIAPAVERAREAGIDAHGPEPPDTVYARAADGEDDCVIAMYHDQGHIPVKMLGFRAGAVTGVNVTIGLPIVRTSVDHGTAFDIAGEGVASAESMIEAVRVAATLARARE